MSSPFIGEIRMFGGNFAPRGFAFCAGQLLSIQQNTALFSILGTTYGGNGQTTFALPNLQNSAPMNQGQGPGLSDRILGEPGGTPTVTLTVNTIPSHPHAPQGSTTSGDINLPNNSVWAVGGGGRGTPAINFYSDATPSAPMSAAAIGLAGASGPHNNMSPYLAVSFIICLVGAFPVRN